jgi:DNA-binding NarL/FixJ family response regulator
MTITILLADDHAIVREGLRFLLEAQPDMEVVAEASDGRDAVQMATELQPAVAIMDITMPGLNGIEASLQIKESCPETRIIVLSMHSTSEHIFRALQAGAVGYLLKESAPPQVVDAVRAVHCGRRYLSPSIMDTLTEDYVHQRSIADADSPLSRLSPREREVLQLVVEGRSSAEIARDVHLSPKTVETYRSRLMAKLGVGDLISLVKFAIQHGLTPPD